MWIKFKQAHNPATMIWLLDPEIKLFSGDIGMVDMGRLEKKVGEAGILHDITKELLELPRMESVSLYDWSKGQEFMLCLSGEWDDDLPDPLLFERCYKDGWERIKPSIQEILAKYLPHDIEFMDEGYANERWYL